MAQYAGQAGRRRRVLDRQLGRISGEPRAPAQAHPARRRCPIPVVVGGDIHSFFANDLRLDFDDPASPVVATEFVGTSISSYGPPYEVIAPALPDNPHVHFFESRRRGYVCVDLERTQMQVRMRVVSDAA